LPNGKAVIREKYPELHCSYRELSGNVSNGCWDGQVAWDFFPSNGRRAALSMFDEGLWEVTATYASHDASVRRVSMDIAVDDLERRNGIAGFASP
jgi:hypothetical protein